MTEDTSNYCAIYTPTFLEKIGWKILPSKHCDSPPMPPLATQRDTFVCRTEVELSFIDRLRVLISGRLRVETKTSTENKLGRHSTNAVGFVAAPSFLDPHYQNLSKQPENA